MKEEIKRNLTIIALDNLINTYSIALENKEITQEDRNYLETCISIAYEIIKDINSQNNKPKWNQL
jgi:hypothetical protein|nr:MAG TPA: hypothetical protein [Caudoviricetes sp.]